MQSQNGEDVVQIYGPNCTLMHKVSGLRVSIWWILQKQTSDFSLSCLLWLLWFIKSWCSYDRCNKGVWIKLQMCYLNNKYKWCDRCFTYCNSMHTIFSFCRVMQNGKCGGCHDFLFILNKLLKTVHCWLFLHWVCSVFQSFKIINFAPTLLQIIVSEQVEFPVRQAG